MADDKPKISFGFSKLVKKPNVIPSAQPKPAETIEYIKCVADNNIQVFNEVKKEETILVIPMKPSHSTSDSKEKIKPTSPENPTEEVKPQTLEELAAKEIVDEVSKKKEVEEKTETFAVPLVSNPPTGEKESTLEDYESIPVEKFGLAMLRGMGFKPGEGIGKNGKLAPPVETPVLRPKGMGLGADKAMKVTQVTDNASKDLKLGVGSHVRLISGENKDNYGKVEGFIEESGRVIVKLARTGKSVIVGEFTLSLVTPDDYSKNCKVLNIAKYEKYKSKEKTSTEIVSDESDQESSKQLENSPSRSYSHSSRSSHRSKHENESSRHSDGRHRSRNDSEDRSSQRSRQENGRSRHSDEQYRSKNDSDSRRDRDFSRRDHETKHSDRRYEDREHYRHKSSKYSKHSRDRSPRRD